MKHSTENPMIVLSLGAGVQSSTLLMKAIRGEIERPHHVIFADTGLEPEAVYRHVDWCEERCKEAGLPFHRVQAKYNMHEEFDAFESGEKEFWNSRPPFYVTSKNGLGQLFRQCTRDIKIRPISRKHVELLGKKTARGLPDGICVSQIGISTDEAKRAVPSKERWQENTYPLIDPLKMSRWDCIAWWNKHYPTVTLPSSACIICPYKTRRLWLNLKERQPADFEKACQLDERYRKAYWEKTNRSIFVHRDGVPLREAVEREQQGDLDFGEDDLYCAGGCGL